MAGQLTIDTLKAGSGVFATQNAMTGICQGWVAINGSSGASPTIRASFNVSSVTRTGTGQYTVTLTTALADTNYVILCTIQQSGTNNNQRVYQSSTVTKTSSVYGIACDDSASYSDYSNVYTAVFR